MAVPTLITDLSTTASSNAPAGSDSPSTLDDIQRAHASFIAQLRDRDSAFALTLLDDATASDMLTTLGVSTFAKTVLDDTTAAAARTTLGAAAAGANTDITSLGAVTGVTADLADDSTKLATTAFVLANAPVVAAASETVAGKIELATGAEAIAGTDAERAITPAGLRSGLNASGTAPVYACRAWVNFNGTGTVAIRASGNVSSITDNGTGNYTVNFTTAMPDANFSAVGTAGTTNTRGIAVCQLPTTAGFQILTSDGNTGATYDSAIVNAAVFR